MEQQFKRWMQSLLETDATQGGEACWRPSADVYRGRGGWLVKFDLAGVRPQDVQLRVEGRRLTVQGVRRDYSILDDQRAYSMEISYNQFRRSLELPCDLGELDVQSEYRDGMLLVLLTPRGREA